VDFEVWGGGPISKGASKLLVVSVCCHKGSA